MLAFLIPESPRLLCAKGRVVELKKAIDRMAWFNRTTVTWTEQELKWVEENANKAVCSTEKEENKNQASKMA